MPARNERLYSGFGGEKLSEERASVRRVGVFVSQGKPNRGVMSDLPALYDTLSCYTAPKRWLDDSLFAGGTVSEQFDKRNVSARLWLNANGQDGYAPRVTYWRPHGYRDGKEIGKVVKDLDAKELFIDEEGELRDGFPFGLLKVEFSIPKMVEPNPLKTITQAQAIESLAKVTEFIRRIYPEAEPLERWTVQRIDYTWMWNTSPNLRAYMAVLHNLRVGGMSRHPYEASEGVVWKAKNRWLKFYNKNLEAGILDPELEMLRFEVSNYKDRVRYMASEWFGNDRTVANLMLPHRGLWVMAYEWDKLGLGRRDHYGSEELLDHRLRKEFGDAVAPAAWALRCIRMYGTASYKEGIELMSSNNYHTWRRKLRDSGLLLTSEDGGDTANLEALPALALPFEKILQNLAQKKGMVLLPIASRAEKSALLADLLDCRSKAESRYLLEEYDGLFTD